LWKHHRSNDFCQTGYSHGRCWLSDVGHA